MPKVNKVTIEYLSNTSKITEKYSDGPVEDEMLDLVMSPNFSAKRAEMLANNPSWPMYYHFTPLRGNVVSWKSFKPGTRILEIGAGCGAVTEALLSITDSTTSIDALELSDKRALINAHRNKDHANLRIVVGNLEDYADGGYDYVVCIGVLEYAGKFISGNNPYVSFLKKLHSFLKPGGEVILAIENKFGIKYMNGAREDHVGRFHESLMDYPQYNGIRTFSKKELKNLFHEAGFSDTNFLLPIPDYKMPTIVLHEDFIDASNDLSFLSRTAPAPSLDQPRVVIGSEQLLTKSSIDAGLYGDMSNSFIVQGRK